MDGHNRDRMERMKAEAKAQLEAAKQAIPTTLTPEQLSELAAAKAKMETAKSSADTAPASTGATGKAEAPPPAQGQAPPVAANSAPPDEPESGFGTEDAKRADLIRKICCASATPWTTTQVDKVLGAPAMRAPIEVLELLLVERSKNPDEKPTKKRGKKNGEEQTREPEQAEMFGGGYNSDADDGAR